MSRYYFVGSGIASLAGAVFLIRDGGVAGKDITIFEECHALGGAFDAHGDAEHGYRMSGSRMRHHENLPLAMITGYKRAAVGTDIDNAPAPR